jgi:hypothetical protein
MAPTHENERLPRSPPLPLDIDVGLSLDLGAGSTKMGTAMIPSFGEVESSGGFHSDVCKKHRLLGLFYDKLP